MSKSPDAFRTISEVADWLGIQAHVLRFWESKFTQVKPIKRAGGRRYYRPADMKLLGGIKQLLHDDGLTIKGVQKLLREEGMSHVAALSQPLEGKEGDVIEAEPVPQKPEREPEPEAVVLPFEPPKDASNETAPEHAGDTTSDQPPSAQEAETNAAEHGSAPSTNDRPEPAEESAVADTSVADKAGDTLEEAPDPSPDGAPQAAEPTPQQATEPSDTVDETADATHGSEETAQEAMSPLPEFLSKPAADLEHDPETQPGEDSANPDTPSEADAITKVEEEQLPSILQDSADHDAAVVADKAPERDHTTPETAKKPAEETASQDEVTTQEDDVADSPAPAPKPRDIGMPDITAETEIHADTAALSRAFRLHAVDAQTAAQMKPLLAQLLSLRDRMAAGRNGAHPKS